MFSDLLEVANVGWMQFRGPKLNPDFLAKDLKERMLSSKNDAEYGMNEDSSFIPDFCTLVLGAFGSSGNVLPNLLADKRPPI